MEAITQWDHGGLFALTLNDKKGTIRKKFPDSLQSFNASVCLSSHQISSPKSFGECHRFQHYQFLHSSQHSPIQCLIFAVLFSPYKLLCRIGLTLCWRCACKCYALAFST